MKKDIEASTRQLLLCSVALLLWAIAVASCRKSSSPAPVVTPPPPDAWKKMADFPGAKRDYGLCFVANNKAYYGGGYYYYTSISNGVYFKDLWEYDPDANKWTRKSDFPGQNSAFIAFGIGRKGYVGSNRYAASVADDSLLNDFWEYDPAADKWTKKTGINTKNMASGGVSFSAMSKGYVQFYYGLFYEYDPVDDSWTQLTPCPYLKDGIPICFSTGNRGYLYTRDYKYWGDMYFGRGLFCEYNTTLDRWTPKASFNNDSNEFSFSYGFAIGSLGYMTGCSFKDSTYTVQNSIWAYDPAADRWTKKVVSNLNTPDDDCSERQVFSIGTKGYVIVDSTLWAYQP